VNVYCKVEKRNQKWTAVSRFIRHFCSMPRPSVAWTLKVLIDFVECLQDNKSKLKPQSFFHKMLKHSHNLKGLFCKEGSGGHFIHKFKYKCMVSRSYVLNFKNHAGAIAREQNIETWTKELGELIRDIRSANA